MSQNLIGEDVEVPVEESAPQEADVAETIEAEAEDTEVEAKEPENKFQARINKLGNKISAYEAELEEQRGRNKALQHQLEQYLEKQSQPKSSELKEPLEEDFDDAIQYYEARATYAANKEVSRLQEELERNRRAEEAENFVKARWDAILPQVETMKSQHPDYVQSVQSLNLQPSAYDAIPDLDNGPKVAYYLAKNPELLNRVNTAKPSQAAIVLAKIEAEMQAAEKTRSNAPEPGSTVKTSNSNLKRDPLSMEHDISTWIKNRSKQVRESRR